MYTIDFNSDIGESYGAFKVGQDEPILDIITSANIACGYHAGDHNVMAQTVALAAQKNVAVGAHPGFYDLMGFGRRNIKTSTKDIYNSVVYQISALNGFCKIYNVTMQHVKPHGALYNMAATDPKIAEAIAEAVYDYNPNLILFGLSGKELVKAGEKIGLNVANEVFADRTYQNDGTLTPRTSDKAMIKDVNEAKDQVLMMIKEGKVKSVDGTIIELQADTVCIHGDEPTALLFAQQLRYMLLNEGIWIKSIGEL